MGILNRASEGMHSVLVVLVRVLQSYGPMERERLEQFVAPSTVTDGQCVRQTLNRWLDLGLLVEENERVGLHPGCGGIDVDSIGGLRRLGALLRGLLLDPANNREFLEPEPSKGADFTHALCWALAQDPFDLSQGKWESINPRQLDQYTKVPRAFQNDTRWVGFQDWAKAVGFASSIFLRKTCLLDPTHAIEDTLSELYTGYSELPQAEFFSRLAQRLPVIDRGLYRQQVEARLGGSWRRIEEHEVSPSLSLALLRLEAAGRIRLDCRSDAEYRTLLGKGFGILRPVSHLALLESAT